MTKKEFVDQIAAKTDLSRPEAEKAVDAFLETVTETLMHGQDITFTGFGKFSTQRRAARQGVNPRLDQAAAKLRANAEELEESEAEFRSRMRRSRETLREIATA